VKRTASFYGLCDGALAVVKRTSYFDGLLVLTSSVMVVNSVEDIL
jgi:hypothetical protein